MPRRVRVGHVEVEVLDPRRPYEPAAVVREGKIVLRRRYGEAVLEKELPVEAPPWAARKGVLDARDLARILVPGAEGLRELGIPWVPIATHGVARLGYAMFLPLRWRRSWARYRGAIEAFLGGPQRGSSEK